MSKQEPKDQAAEDQKVATVTKKLKSEREKYFVPEFGEVEAESLGEVQEIVSKLKDKQEDK